MSKKDKAEPVNLLSLTEYEVFNLIDKTLKKLSKKVHLIVPDQYDLETSIAAALHGCWTIALQRASVVGVFPDQSVAPMVTSFDALVSGNGQCPWCEAHTSSMREDGRWECGSCDAIGEVIENTERSGLIMLSNENVNERVVKETIH